MRTPVIAGNWKMHKTIAESVDLVRAMRRELNAVETVESVICPTFIAIPSVADALSGTHIAVGAQNMFWAEQGAYTGEIAPGMLVGYCKYVILGHSERRQYFGETDEGVNKKAHAAFAHSLIPIVAVGENLEQNKSGETDIVVRTQLGGGLKGLTKEQVAALVIAYEPVWAIGTGKTATTQQAQDAHAFIRKVLAAMFDEGTAKKVRIQYGGSVKPNNAKELMSQTDVDGALVGGASLESRSFADIIRNSI